MTKTNNLQPLYDIFGEAFKAGMEYGEEKHGHITAAEILFPLAARMEAEIGKLFQWHPIATAPKDHSEDIIVGFDMATVWIVRNAFWDEGEMWEGSGFDSQDDARGWWSYDNCVGQVKLEGLYEPTHWMPLPSSPERET